jgi:acetyl esterase
VTAPAQPIVFATWPATTEAPFDPYLRQLAAAQATAPPTESLPPAEARRLMRERGVDVPTLDESVARIEERAIPGPGGDLPIRLYTPEGEGPFPVVLYYHGGGWVLGDLDTGDDYCRSLCARVPAVVVSVDYRLAPEHPFPAGLDDCVAALGWVHAHAAAIEGDPARLAVAGGSAGGNLAAAVALHACDHGGPALAAQLLIFPVTNSTLDTASYHRYATDHGLTRSAMAYFWRCYLARPEDGDSPYAAVLRAPDLAGLPPALIQTAQYDPLCDEGEAYAARLARSGVPVECVRYLGMNHGFVRQVVRVEGARQALADAAATLRRLLAPVPAGARAGG